MQILQNISPNNNLPTLKKRAQFLRLARGRKIWGTSFILQSAKQKLPATQEKEKRKQAQIGYTVTKKMGNAPTRNRIKRRLRAASAKCSLHFKPEYDYVLVGKREALWQDFSTLVKELENCLNKIHKGQKYSNKFQNRKITEKK